MSAADLIAVAAAYFTGSVSFAIITCRLAGKTDPRGAGSGNPGATNVLQAAGKWPAAATLCGDVAKSFIPVFVAVKAGLSDATIAAMMVASVVGHLFPVFHRFSGGKGVASCAGVLFGARPEAGFVWLGIWVIVALVSRYSSLAGISACALAPVILFAGPYPRVLALAGVVIAVLVIARHHRNIRGLLDGTERRLF